MKCPNLDCGAENLEGAMFCEECGSELPQEKVIIEDSKQVEEVEEKASLKAKLVVVKPEEHAGKEVGITKDIVLLGRTDPTSDINPDADLTAYDAAEGISRKHANLSFTDGQYSLTDLGSTNGSYVNKKKLEANVPCQLNDGDEIILGRTVFKFHIVG